MTLLFAISHTAFFSSVKNPVCPVTTGTITFSPNHYPTFNNTKRNTHNIANDMPNRSIQFKISGIFDGSVSIVVLPFKKS